MRVQERGKEDGCRGEGTGDAPRQSRKNLKNQGAVSGSEERVYAKGIKQTGTEARKQASSEGSRFCGFLDPA